MSYKKTFVVCKINITIKSTEGKAKSLKDNNL